jgi:AcrR family transcriptional regulator
MRIDSPCWRPACLGSDQDVRSNGACGNLSDMTPPDREPRPAPRPRGAGGTREQVVDATLETLKRGGLKNASARAIARTGGFNPALIFYYFGSLDRVLLAALDEASGVSLARWTMVLERAGRIEELLAAVLAQYREDVASGHTTVVAELIGASHARPELRPGIIERTEPWLELIETTMTRVLAGSPFEHIATPRELAYVGLSLSLGVNLFVYLDTDSTRVESLFSLAERVAPLLGMLLPADGEPG